jgi:bile acid:Na+ symporter, BASS family
MQRFFSIVNHRDFVLILALVIGLIAGEHTRPLAEISVFTLALVMVFATTGFSFTSWIPLKNTYHPIALSTLLNFIIFGMMLIGFSWLFFSNDPDNHFFPYYIGFVLVAAAPPGPSVIPFAAILRGDNNFSVTGVFGLHILAMVLTPLILLIFLGESLINPAAIFNIMVKLIIIPLIISRFLRHPRVLPAVEKIRETVIKWGFFLVIVPIMGMSSKVFFLEPQSLLIMSFILLLTMYVMGFANHMIMKNMGIPRSTIISSTLMMTTKSSAFSAVAAFTFFDGHPMIAMPSAVVSVFVTLFIIVYPWFLRWYERRSIGK